MLGILYWYMDSPLQVARSASFSSISVESGALILQFLHVREICVWHRISHLFHSFVSSSLRKPRHVYAIWDDEMIKKLIPLCPNAMSFLESSQDWTLDLAMVSEFPKVPFDGEIVSVERICEDAGLSG